MSEPLRVTPLPRVGVESVVEVGEEAPVGGAPVRVIFRPGLPGQHEAAVGITDAAGQVRWTPAEPGAVMIEAGELSAVVHVAPSAVPVDLGVHLVVLAAVITWLVRRGR